MLLTQATKEHGIEHYTKGYVSEVTVDICVKTQITDTINLEVSLTCNRDQPLYPRYQAESGLPQVTSNQLCFPSESFLPHSDNMQKQHILVNSLPCLRSFSCIHYAANISKF